MNNNNPNNAQLKCLLNVVFYYAAFLLLLVGLSFFRSFFPANLEKLSFGLIGLLSAGVITYLFLRKDKSSFRDIGLFYQNSTLKKFVSGAFIGVALMGMASMAVVLLSGFQIETNANSGWINFFVWTLPLAPLALMEEIPARGYALVRLKTHFSTRITILITTLLFVCSHLAYGWSVADALLGPGIMGILFAVLAIYSDGIAMPTGVHYGFNLMTAAFAANDQSFNLWVLKGPDGQSLENFQQSLAATLLPNIFFLIIGIALTELYIRKKLP